MDPITLAFAAAKFIPDIVGWIAGDDAEDKAKKVVDVVENVTGLRGENAVKALENSSALQVKARELLIEEIRVHAQDRDSARKMMGRLAEAKHGAAWGPVIISSIITLGFFGILYSVLKSEIPEGSNEIALILLGSLGAAFVQVCNFWLGSSKGSKDKTAHLVGAMK